MTQDKIQIRNAAPTDITFIAESQLLMAMETEQLQLDKETVFHGARAIFDDNTKGFYIIAESADGIAGCLMITPEWSDWRNAWMWWIQSVYVLPAFRKSGVFAQMYTHIQQMAQQRSDVRGIRLYVDNTNLKAREVYKCVGMSDEHYRTFEWMK